MAELMRALRKLEAGPGAALQQVPIPTVGPRDVLVRVRAASICGTDYHIYSWDPWAAGRVKPPLTIGHELAGEVVAVGREVTACKVGDYVSAESHIVCNQCPRCRVGEYHLCEHTRILGVDTDGVFAEYVAIPEQNVWVNDKDIPFELQSIQEPLGNAVHTALSGDLTARSVLVTGCGPIGIMSVPVAKMAGAEIVIAMDVNEYRLELAGRLGADLLINPMREDPVEVVRGATRGYGADVVLEMSGNPSAIRQALKAARNGARISLLGLPGRPLELDLAADVIMRGLVLQGITGRRMWQTWYQVRSLYRAGLAERLRPLITHRLPLEQVDTAMELMGSGRSGKIVLVPDLKA
ncbi:MAG: L-threonine 3-dehydrogenase [Symbiobacterium sp.]|uniref:L-threonine 3-dehydrogenase n=1 Tax=Symbiobacterium sp. TaxID=1971213 RepID=UPI0034642102